jgi:hypothetical protein
LAGLLLPLSFSSKVSKLANEEAAERLRRS